MPTLTLIAVTLSLPLTVAAVLLSSALSLYLLSRFALTLTELRRVLRSLRPDADNARPRY